MAAFTYTSQDAYNGCLSLFSAEERAHRSGVAFLELEITESRKILFQQKLLEYKIEQQKRIDEEGNRLPRLACESVSDIIDESLYIEDYHTVRNSLDSWIPSNGVGKIRVCCDDRDFDDLRLMFPAIHRDLLQTIWALDLSWITCRDILSALLLSNATTIALSFTLDLNDDVNWPTLNSVYCVTPIRKLNTAQTLCRNPDDNASLVCTSLCHRSEVSMFSGYSISLSSLNGSANTNTRTQQQQQKRGSGSGSDHDDEDIVSRMSWSLCDSDNGSIEEAQNNQQITPAKIISPLLDTGSEIGSEWEVLSDMGSEFEVLTEKRSDTMTKKGRIDEVDVVRPGGRVIPVDKDDCDISIASGCVIDDMVVNEERKDHKEEEEEEDNQWQNRDLLISPLSLPPTFSQSPPLSIFSSPSPLPPLLPADQPVSALSNKLSYRDVLLLPVQIVNDEERCEDLPRPHHLATSWICMSTIPVSGCGRGKAKEKYIEVEVDDLWDEDYIEVYGGYKSHNLSYVVNKNHDKRRRLMKMLKKK